MLRGYVCPPLGEDEYFKLNEGTVDVRVAIAPLIEQRKTKPKTVKRKPKAAAKRRKR
jgi:hypothetical protein